MTKRRKRSIKRTQHKRPKKEIEVTIRKKVLGKAPEEYHFVLADSRKLDSILSLVNSLEDMSEDVFRHHVNEAKNDFANWIKDVFKEENLAKDIKEVNNKVETQIKLLKHIVNKAIR
jgi:DNA polymerase III delta subunit